MFKGYFQNVWCLAGDSTKAVSYKQHSMQIFSYFLPHNNKSLWRCNWAVVTSVNKLERLFVPLMKVPFPALIKGLCMCRHVQSSYGMSWAPTPLPRTPTDTVSSAVTHHLAIFWTLTEFRHVAGGPAPALVRGWKTNLEPTCYICSVVYCIFFYPSVAKRFQLHLELFFFFFTLQAVSFHVTSLLLVLVFSAGTWNIFSVLFHGLCCTRRRPGYIGKSCFSLIFSHPRLLLSSFLSSCWRALLPWMNLFGLDFAGINGIKCVKYIYKHALLNASQLVCTCWQSRWETAHFSGVNL